VLLSLTLYVLLALALALVAHLLLAWRTERDLRGALASVRRHVHRHLHVALAVLIVGNLALGFAARPAVEQVLRRGGALFNTHYHKAVDPALAQRGRGGPAASPDLERYLPPIYNQGNTSACGPHALVTAIYAQIRAQGGRPPVLSPWQNYYYAAGNSPAGTSMDEDVGAAAAHGVETFAGWPTLGGPDGTDAAQTTRLPYVRVDTLFYQPQGWNGLYAVEAALNAGYTVILLHRVNDGEYNAYGQSVTDNAGGFHFNHFAVAYKHLGDVLYLRNSWGGSYGARGDIGFTPAAFLNTVLAAYVVHVGVPGAWQPPAPTATARPKPTVTPRPRPTSTPPPHPTATPRPTPTPVPMPAVVHHAANLRATPAKNGRVLQGLPAGTHVLDLRRRTPHWSAVRVRTPHGIMGWVLTTTLH
jgi:hypothetical protein